MSGDWDLVFALRIAELNARLAQDATLPLGTPLSASAGTQNINVTASLESVQVVEVPQGATRKPGIKPALTMQMILVGIHAEGSGLAQFGIDGSFDLDFAKIYFDITLQYVKMENAESKLVFDPTLLKDGPVTVDPEGLTTTQQQIVAAAAKTWLTGNFDKLSPVFALFGTGDWALGPTSYAYVQADKDGDDILCVCAMLSQNAAAAPEVIAQSADFVNGGDGAFLLSTSALLNDILLPPLNAFATAQCQYSGTAFVYDAKASKLTLAPGVQLQSATIENTLTRTGPNGNPAPLLITNFEVAYGQFDQTDGLSFNIEQDATFYQAHYYYSGGPNGQYSRPEYSPWCKTWRKQSSVMGVSLGTDANGEQTIKFVALTDGDDSGSEAIPGGTGNAWVDNIVNMIEGALQSAVLIAGPIGLAFFLLDLGVTTAGKLIDLEMIKDAQNLSQPLSPDTIIQAISFEWGGIGELNYTSAAFDGGLKLIGTKETGG